VDGGVGWLGLGATLPEYRGRGAQSAILAARIEHARRLGCATVVTETGELADDRPSSSYRNIVRAGFREAGVRRNYRAPSA
jgi:GNAT superfamily N-acetyltransferase